MNFGSVRLRRTALRDLALVAVALIALAVVSVVKGTDSASGSGDSPWVFVSIPDFLNADVANPDEQWDDVLDYTLDRVEEEQPDFVLVPGDLVLGEWSNDPETISRQAAIFYSAWKQRFEEHDLTFYPLLGDHEIGDNPWPAEKAQAVPAYKRAFRENFELPDNGPSDEQWVAYSVRHKNLLLVALDAFGSTDERVSVGVAGTQLEWATETFASREANEHLIVSSHVPILSGARARNSSRIRLPGGAGTPIWEAITQAGTDLYLAGELHDASAQEKDGVLQIVHGSAPAFIPEINYLVAKVYPDRIETELKAIRLTLDEDAVVTDDPAMPPGSAENLPQAAISPDIRQSGPQSLGGVTVRSTPEGHEYANRSGYFDSRYRNFDGSAPSDDAAPTGSDDTTTNGDAP
ncbi:MAG: metallophosphoesterase [Thermoleophilia bacterium]|nr:metallophosphoesterase [Thermoleophilia bacterium]